MTFFNRNIRNIIEIVHSKNVSWRNSIFFWSLSFSSFDYPELQFIIIPIEKQTKLVAKVHLSSIFSVKISFKFLKCSRAPLKFNRTMTACRGICPIWSQKEIVITSSWNKTDFVAITNHNLTPFSWPISYRLYDLKSIKKPIFGEITGSDYRKANFYHGQFVNYI